MNTKDKLKACLKIKCLWDQRKLSQIYQYYHHSGLCMLMRKLGSSSQFDFMDDITKAAKGKPYFSGSGGYPIKDLTGKFNHMDYYEFTQDANTTFDRRTPHGKARYKLLCDLITYYEERIS